VSSVAIVWLIVGLVSTLAVLAVVIGLIRHVLVLFRALRRFADEVAPISAEIASLGDRTSRGSARLRDERPFGRGGDRTVR
jgi:hypothetical protein